jgi:hypothetical protein
MEVTMVRISLGGAAAGAALGLATVLVSAVLTVGLGIPPGASWRLELVRGATRELAESCTGDERGRGRLLDVRQRSFVVGRDRPERPDARVGSR